MENSLKLIQADNSEINTHGGRMTIRHFLLVINNVFVDEFHDRNSNTNYNVGVYLDKHINSILERYEAALRTKVVRVLAKGNFYDIRQAYSPWNNDATLHPRLDDPSV